MDLHDSPEDAAFRAEARDWLEANLTGEFAEARGLGRAGLQHEGREVRTGLGAPARGGRLDLCGLARRVRRPGGVRCPSRSSATRSTSGPTRPARVNVMGEGLLGPTLIAYGTEAQKQRFLPPIRRGAELWCQGYSEPDAGSRPRQRADQGRARRRRMGDHRPEGLDLPRPVGRLVLRRLPHRPRAPRATRASPTSSSPCTSPASRCGPSCRSPGRREFNEVFFDGARTAATYVVGEVDDGWRVALATLAFERGVALLGTSARLPQELDAVIATARQNGALRRSGHPPAPGRGLDRA